MLTRSKQEAGIDKAKREVEYKKRIAEEEGLDRLLLQAYHGSIRYYPLWIKSAREKAYVHPAVGQASERVEKEPSGDTFITEFSMGAKRYTLASEHRGTFFTKDVYYVITLFINDVKVFAVSEKHDVRLKGAHYYALNIEAYMNEDWVEDFRSILEHQDEVARMLEKMPNEDPEVLERLKTDFSLDDRKIIRIRAWPRYKAYRLVLLLVILSLTIFTFLEFQTLIRAR
jgi:hypothetical protein